MDPVQCKLCWLILDKLWIFVIQVSNNCRNGMSNRSRISSHQSRSKHWDFPWRWSLWWHPRTTTTIRTSRSCVANNHWMLCDTINSIQDVRRHRARFQAHPHLSKQASVEFLCHSSRCSSNLTRCCDDSFAEYGQSWINRDYLSQRDWNHCVLSNALSIDWM